MIPSDCVCEIYKVSMPHLEQESVREILPVPGPGLHEDTAGLTGVVGDNLAGLPDLNKGG